MKKINVLKSLLFIPGKDGKTQKLEVGVHEIEDEIAGALIERGYAEPFGAEPLPEQDESDDGDDDDGEPGPDTDSGTSVESESESESEPEPEPEQPQKTSRRKQKNS